MARSATSSVFPAGRWGLEWPGGPGLRGQHARAGYPHLPAPPAGTAQAGVGHEHLGSYEAGLDLGDELIGDPRFPQVSLEGDGTATTHANRLGDLMGGGGIRVVKLIQPRHRRPRGEGTARNRCHHCLPRDVQDDPSRQRASSHRPITAHWGKVAGHWAKSRWEWWRALSRSSWPEGNPAPSPAAQLRCYVAHRAHTRDDRGDRRWLTVVPSATSGKLALH